MGDHGMTSVISRVVIANGQEIVRDAIATLLTKHCAVEIVAKTEEGYNTIKVCRQLSPDILVLDMDVIRPSGPEILTRVNRSLPNLKILAVSDDPSAASVYFALSRGTTAFITRGAKTEDYIHAVNATVNGYTFLPQDLFSAFMTSKKSFSRSGNLFNLSNRELEVLEACVSGGLNTREVAEVLQISMRTVEKHRHNIYKKSGNRDITKIFALISQADDSGSAAIQSVSAGPPLRVVVP